jgi:xylose dehydrogenase (NAD/NADP)
MIIGSDSNQAEEGGMAKDSIRWGLLSTARISRRLIPAIRAAERNELVAVASRELGKAAEYAVRWGISRIFGSYEEMLDSDQVDAVYISLPNALHAEWAVRAAEAGKHVLCEKPLALTTAEVDRISAAAEASGVVAAEAVMYLYHPLIARLAELVQNGAVGEVQLVRGAFTFTLDRARDVRWQPELGGGSLWDVGSYPVSLIRRLLGEPEEVFGWQRLTESGVDESFAGLLRFVGGAVGSFDAGFRHPFRVEAEVVGSKGVLRLERPYVMAPKSSIVIRRGDDEEVESTSSADPYQCEVEAIAAGVLDGAPLPVPLSSSRANVATLLALYRSAREGVPQSPA